jgi:beta-xylosidase
MTSTQVSPSIAFPWIPDDGHGSYRNPIICADYSDPDVIRHGDDYYLTASSFNCTPGLPILHSRDLVNWTLLNHALQNLPDPRYDAVQPGCGVWAPAIRFHAGKFWIFFPTPDDGIFVTTADHPAGRWSEPHLLQAGKGLIDPAPLWDNDGKAYLVHAYAGSRAGIRDILRVRPMAPDASRLLGEGQIVFTDPERHPTIEGPKFLKRNGWYYISAPAGGVPTGWQVILRSQNVYGPYEDKIVLAQRDTAINGPHQGALVETPTGEWWFVHFQDADVYGRIVHLQPVRWEDDWPMIGVDQGDRGIGRPVQQYCKPAAGAMQVPQTSDEFDGYRLGLQWQWNANHREEWFSMSARPEWLRLFPQLIVAPLSRQPNLLLQKFPARTFCVETSIELHAQQAGEEAGLVLAGESPLAVGIRHTGSQREIVLRVADTVVVLASTPGSAARFRTRVADGGACTFAYATDSDFVELPDRYQATKGVWIGARIGLYSVKPSCTGASGHVDVGYFRFKENS